METQKNPQQKRNWPIKKIILSAIGGILLLYFAVLTYLYFYPALDFIVELPTNPPSVLTPKQQSIQTHVNLIPGNGLGQFGFFIIPSSHTNFYANVDGGSLVEEKAATATTCTATASTSCDTLTTPKGQQYILTNVKDASAKTVDAWIHFTRNQTSISIELSQRPRALSKAVIDAYIDSFQPVYKSFPVEHLTPGI